MPPDPPASRRAPRILDGHVHLIGDGSSGSGCRIALRGFGRKVLARGLLRACRLPWRCLRGGLDRAYSDQLLHWVLDAPIDGALVLAMDYPHDGSGRALHGEAAFYTPNDAVLSLALEHPEVIPAVSIHPGRPDAIAELERCHAAGAPVVKLLPNVHRADPSNPAYFDFWKAMAERGMILLSHTGGELSLPNPLPEFADPVRLRGPLDAGVTVIAAHCGSPAHPWDRDYTDAWIEMLPDYPNLFGDISALSSPLRARTLRRLLDTRVQERLVHGSDYPIPVVASGPWIRGVLGTAATLPLLRIRNPLTRAVRLHRSAGFHERVFTRLDTILQGAGPQPPERKGRESPSR